MFFQLLVQGDFMGLDEDTKLAPSADAVAVAQHPRVAQTYYYKTGVYGECSAACNGGMRYRSVECRELNSVNPRVVDETKCITQRIRRPQSQEACNMHRCVHAEYSVSSFGAVSDFFLFKFLSRLCLKMFSYTYIYIYFFYNSQC